MRCGPCGGTSVLSIVVGLRPINEMGYVTLARGTLGCYWYPVLILFMPLSARSQIRDEVLTPVGYVRVAREAR